MTVTLHAVTDLVSLCKTDVLTIGKKTPFKNFTHFFDLRPRVVDLDNAIQLFQKFVKSQKLGSGGTSIGFEP